MSVFIQKSLLLNFIWFVLLLLLSSCGAQVITTPDIGSTSLTPTEVAAQPPTVVPNLDVLLLRGNPQRTGVYDLPGMREQPEIQWEARVDYTLLTAPLVAKELLYTISLRGVMYALEVETGEEVWSVEGLGQHENTGAIAGDMVISAGINQQVRARDRQNGDELWTFKTEYPVLGAPLIVGDRVYIATDRAVHALDVKSGKLIWTSRTAEEAASFLTGAPAYEDGVIYANAGKLLFALDGQTGKEIWRVEKDEQFWGLAVANNLIYVPSWDRHLYAFDRLTGEELWEFEGAGEFWSAPAVTSETVYAGNNDQFYALDARSGELLWSFQASGEPVSEPLVTDGVVYFSDSNHEVQHGTRHLYALDAGTGEQLWVFEKEGTYLPAPALGDDVIYITMAGEVVALK
jgi:outer membrane protein assembly factor BamB